MIRDESSLPFRSGSDMFRSRMKYQDLLLSEFRKRKIVNPRYSVRGFARFLGVDPSTLSQVLRGKRAPGKAFLESTGRRLGLNESEVLSFRDRARPSTEMPIDLDDVRYRIMANWYHVALFELFALPDFTPEPKRVAKLLGISVPEAKGALDRLATVGLLEKNAEGILERPSSFFSTVGYPLSSPAHRLVQGEFFSYALNAIEKYAYDRREHSGLTVAARSEDLPAIRKKIRDFQTKLNTWIERRGNPDSVYQLSMAYFPLVESEKVHHSKEKRK
jgi:transcriptional regulator with XRE-family HTH domain